MLTFMLFNVSDEISNTKSYYDFISEDELNYYTEEVKEKFKNVITNPPVQTFNTDIFMNENLEVVDEDNQYDVGNGIYANKVKYKLNLNNYNLDEGLYKLYIITDDQFVDKDMIEDNDLDINKFYTKIKLNGAEVFSMNNFKWLNKDNDEDTSSNKLLSKYIDESKAYLTMAKYADGYTLTSKTYNSKKPTIVEEIKENVVEKVVPKAGDNILIYVSLLLVIIPVVILKKKLKRA